MKKTLSFLSLCFGLSAIAAAQTTPLPYYTGFEDLMPPATWQSIRKGADDPNYTWVINNTTPYAGNYSLSHKYPVGGVDATDDWYISPAFSLSSGGKIDSIRHHFSGFGTPMAGDTIAIYLLKGNADPELATAKTLLYDFRDSRYTADFLWNKTTNIDIPPTSGTAYIAIRYRTVNNWLDVRFDNVKISSNSSSSIGDRYLQGKDFSVAPVPAINTVTINTKIAFDQIAIYDAAGRMMHRQSFQPTIDVSGLAAGIYRVILTDANQQKGAISIIKQ